MKLLFLLTVAAGLVAWAAGVEVLAPGSTIQLRCRIAVDENALTQIIKKHVYIERTNSKHTFSGPYVIANNTELDPLLLNMTSRYSLSVSNGYMLTITDARPEDSGTWVCKQIRESGATLEVSMRDFLVAGPLKRILWRSDDRESYNIDHGTPSDVIAEGSTVTVNYTARRTLFSPRPDVYCDVISSNIEPTFNITIGNISDPNHKDITGYFLRTSASSVTLHNGGLVYFTERTTFRPAFSLKFEPDDNGKELHCRAAIEIGRSDLIDNYVILDIHYPPEDVTCESSYPRFPIGWRNASVSCEVRGNPPPEVTWALVDTETMVTETAPIDGYSVQNTITGDRVTTTLNIEMVTKRDYGALFVIARNKYQGHSFVVRLSEGPVGGASLARACASWLLASALVVTGAVVF